MNRIKILSEAVKNKIAAGEVVEGPFSVVKELMENAIDAQASEIDVEVLESGLKKILVKDNGVGILKDDLPLAVKNHATSKINRAEDIEQIASYGFRGEALASIASISGMTILSRSTQETTGARIVSRDSERSDCEISDFAGVAGTTVIIENLFYNVPARKKFLKSKSYELRRLRETFLKIALAHPETAFTFSSDGKRQITLAKGSLDERVRQIYGSDILNNLYFETLKDIDVEISGYLSKPDFLKSSRSMQLIYVNSRPVEYPSFGFLMSKAYEAIAQRGQYPAAIIFINIKPELIDVNIHPAKREIKFFDQKYMNSMLLNIAEKALNSRPHDIRTFHVKEAPAPSDNTENLEMRFEPRENELRRVFSNPAVNYTHQRVTPFVNDVAKFYTAVSENFDIKYLGIAFDTYIIVQQTDSIYFIDFHAAHERIIYDKIMSNQIDLETQTIIPRVIELSLENYQILLENLEYLRQYAFDIEDYADKSFVINGIPFADSDPESLIVDIAEALRSEKDHIEDIKKTVAAQLACHSAKKAGERLTDDDAKMLAEQALSGTHSMRCPHGRPYLHKIEKNELDKVFKRI